MDRTEFLKRVSQVMWKHESVAATQKFMLELTSRPEFMDFIENEGFLTAPASTKYHGAYVGGLVDHSLNVLNRLMWMTHNLQVKWEKWRSPFIVGLFHDICKHDQYIWVPEENRFIYNMNTKLSGHGSKSVEILSNYFDLTDQEKAAIRYHMGAYEKDDWAGFDEAIRKWPSTLICHTADMYASKVDEEK